MAGAIARAEQDLARLREEIADLEQRLSTARDKASKLAVFLELAPVYGMNGESTTTAVDAVNSAPHDDQQRLSQLRTPKGGVSGRAMREATAIIRERGRPMHTRELLEILRARGIEIGGQNPVGNLSGYLCRTPELVSDRASGWSLKEWSQSKSAGEKQPSLAVGGYH